MGGRGGASGIGKKSQSALDPKAKEQTITTYYRRNSIYGAHYGDDVFEAVDPFSASIVIKCFFCYKEHRQ